MINLFHFESDWLVGHWNHGLVIFNKSWWNSTINVFFFNNKIIGSIKIQDLRKFANTIIQKFEKISKILQKINFLFSYHLSNIYEINCIIKLERFCKQEVFYLLIDYFKRKKYICISINKILVYSFLYLFSGPGNKKLRLGFKKMRRRKDKMRSYEEKLIESRVIAVHLKMIQV